MKWIYFYRLTIGSFYADTEAAAHVIRSFKMGDDRILLYSRSRFCRSCSTNANRHGSPAHNHKQNVDTKRDSLSLRSAKLRAMPMITSSSMNYGSNGRLLHNDVIIITSHHYNNGRLLYRTNDCIIVVCIIVQ